MLSAETKNMERFVDGVVAPHYEAPVSSGAAGWTNMQYGDTNVVQSNQAMMNSFNAAQMPNSYQMMQNSCGSGTEIWGERPSGNEWRAVAEKTSLQEWSSMSRPPIQSRAPQWPQQNYQSMQQTPQMVLQPDSFLGYQENASVAQNSNEIQSLVCDLIRQNNMKKPYNLPPWVDVSRPPPPLPNLMSAPPMQYDAQTQKQNDNFRNSVSPMQSVKTQQPQYHTQAKSDVPISQQLPNTIATQLTFDGRGDNFSQYNSGVTSAPPHYDRQNNRPSQSVTEIRRSSQDKQKAIFYNPLVREEGDNAAGNLDQELKEGGDQNTYTRKYGDAENKMNRKLPSLVTSQNPTQSKSIKEYFSTQETLAMPNEMDKMSLNVDNNWAPAVLDTVKISSHDLTMKELNVGAENGSKEGWNKQSSKPSHLNKKKPFFRQPSAADLDPDWRRRDSEEDSSHPQWKEWGSRVNSFENESKSGLNQRRYSRQESEDSEVFKPSPLQESNDEIQQQTKPRERKKIGDALHVEQGGRHVTQTSKAKLLCWLQQNDELPSEDSVGKEIRHLQITDAESDFSKFIEATQSFATNEAKMREVAEILCNKALKDSRYGRNVSLLCDRLSFMMVHGTKFRNVVLNVMQGHYKNREQLFSASFRHDKRWFGFVSFLVELFLNLNTASRERLNVLTSPVFNCFFQVLHSEKVDKVHIECFGHMFKQVGPTLESECPDRLDQLLEHMRDRCVLSKTAFVRRVLLHCVEFYASKWQAL